MHESQTCSRTKEARYQGRGCLTPFPSRSMGKSNLLQRKSEQWLPWWGRYGGGRYGCGGDVKVPSDLPDMFYPDVAGGYRSTYTCKNTPSCTPNICVLCCKYGISHYTKQQNSTWYSARYIVIIQKFTDIKLLLIYDHNERFLPGPIPCYQFSSETLQEQSGTF